MPLFDVADVVFGYAFRSEFFTSRTEGMPLIRIRDLRKGECSIRTTERYDERYVVRPGDLVVGMDAEFRAYIWRGEPAVLNQRVCKIVSRGGRELIPFLRAALLAPLRALEDNKTGTTVAHLNKRDLEKVMVTSLPMEDQRRIAGVLGALDDKIELNRRMNETLSALARTLYRRLENEVASEASVYEYARVAYGAPFASAQFNSRREGMPLIRIRDLATFAPEVWTTQRLPRETVIEPGDLVVGMDGEFRAQIWLGDRALLNQRVCSFQPKNRVPLSFLWQAVRADLAFYEQAKTGTTVIHLGKSDIDRFTTPAPSVEQLAAFSSQAEPLVAKLVSNAQESGTLADLRDALLPKLISGELRVRDPEPT